MSGFPNNPERAREIERTATLDQVPTLYEIIGIYNGSDGDATLALYAKLRLLGPAGVVALNLFRAHKTSHRAKKYRGGVRGVGSYRSMSYDRKEFSIEQLDRELRQNAEQFGLVWGWGSDPEQRRHAAVLFVDLPTGQVSFHTTVRGMGPDYPGTWDAVRGVGMERICAWCAYLFGHPLEIVPGAPEARQEGLL